MFAAGSVTQRLASGPVLIQKGLPAKPGNWVMIPVFGSICPILPPLLDSANQRLPSMPAVIPFGVPPTVGNSVITGTAAPTAMGVRTIAVAAIAAVATIPIHRGKRALIDLVMRPPGSNLPITDIGA